MRRTGASILAATIAFLSAGGLALAGAGAAPAGEPLKPTRTLTLREGVDIREYSLPNGLTVVLTANPRAPLTSIYHWVKAGSLHETKGITGMAHLFEHMMFRPLAPDKPGFWVHAARLAAQANANTRFASTVYTTTVPDENLREALQLESDRFEKLTVTDELLDVERKAVWSEYSTKMDANPIIDLWDRVYRAGFPGHPYGWMIIGDREDLEKIKATHCNDFFKRLYRPNNTGLFISGNFDPEKVIAWVQELYGDWEKGEDSKLPEPFAARAGAVWAQGKLPSTAKNVLIGYRTPEFDGKNHHLQSFVNHVLFEANLSLARRRLLHDKKMVSAVEGFNFSYDSGMIKVMATLLPGVTKEAAAAEINELVKDFAKLDAAEFQAYLKDYHIAYAEAIQKNESLNESIALSWGKFGSLDAVVESAKAPLSVTQADVQQFLEKYVTSDNMVAVTNKE